MQHDQSARQERISRRALDAALKRDEGATAAEWKAEHDAVSPCDLRELLTYAGRKGM